MNRHQKLRQFCLCEHLPSSMPQELSAANISQWRKEGMRTTLSALKKMVIDCDRAAEAKIVQKV